MGRLYAQNGEQITCENGHEICSAAKDIHLGTTVSVESFQDWKIEAPKVGDAIDGRCPICGAYWMNKTGWELHVGNEWRSYDKGTLVNTPT